MRIQPISGLTASSVPYSFVDTNQKLVDASRVWESRPFVAVDTEFVRVSTYYPIAALIQISTGIDCYLIDPLLVKDLSPLADLVRNESVVKILHACSEDVEVFRYILGEIPRPIFDTQIAEALITGDYSLSYQALVEKSLGIKIPKGETRSNWLQRPLTRSQSQYASLDVVHLPAIYERQLSRLEALGRIRWLEEECTRLHTGSQVFVDPDLYYLRIKSAWKLNGQQLMVLKTLSAWREEQARKSDVPRNHVIPEKALMAFAKDQIKSKSDMSGIADMKQSQIRKSGGQLLSLAEDARGTAEHLWPAELERPSPGKSSQLLKDLKKIVDRRAQELQVAPEMLATRRQLHALIRVTENGGQKFPEELDGWRRKAIGETLLQEIGALRHSR